MSTLARACVRSRVSDRRGVSSRVAPPSSAATRHPTHGAANARCSQRVHSIDNPGGQRRGELDDVLGEGVVVRAGAGRDGRPRVRADVRVRPTARGHAAATLSADPVQGLRLAAVRAAGQHLPAAAGEAEEEADRAAPPRPPAGRGRRPRRDAVGLDDGDAGLRGRPARVGLASDRAAAAAGRGTEGRPVRRLVPPPRRGHEGLVHQDEAHRAWAGRRHDRGRAMAASFGFAAGGRAAVLGARPGRVRGVRRRRRSRGGAAVRAGPRRRRHPGTRHPRGRRRPHRRPRGRGAGQAVVPVAAGGDRGPAARLVPRRRVDRCGPPPRRVGLVRLGRAGGEEPAAAADPHRRPQSHP